MPPDTLGEASFFCFVFNNDLSKIMKHKCYRLIFRMTKSLIVFFKTIRFWNSLNHNSFHVRILGVCYKIDILPSLGLRFVDYKRCRNIVWSRIIRHRMLWVDFSNDQIVYWIFLKPSVCNHCKINAWQMWQYISQSRCLIHCLHSIYEPLLFLRTNSSSYSLYVPHQNIVFIITIQDT